MTINSSDYAVLSIIADLLVALNAELSGDNIDDLANIDVELQVRYYERMTANNRPITFVNAKNRLACWRNMGITIS